MNRLLSAALPALLLGACAGSPATGDAAATPAAAPAGAVSLEAAIAGDWRSPTNAARDRYRHPRETLGFFGVQPGQTVVEITPGGGWYAEILAPWLADTGHYVAALARPTAPDGEASADRQALATRFAADPAHFGSATTIEFDPQAPVFGPPASADAVLTFRNVHNWVMAGTQAAMFRGFYEVLKPGGVLGVTDHRANPGPATDGRQGYVTEQQVIDYANAAGFVLDGRSEINANPKDRKTYPQGVWTLPPSLALGDRDRATYLAIGESDRMTLRFRKPRHD
ncbi:MAG: class I SAM-dependent methyltransferase [Luteimonas sp.]